MLTILGIIAGIIWGVIVATFRLWDRPGYLTGHPGWWLNPGRGRRDRGAAGLILGTLRAAPGARSWTVPALDPGRGRHRSRVAADPGADRAARAALIPFVAVAVALLFGRR